MAFRDLHCEDGVPAEVFLGIVTGTHSAGKSTVIEAFGDPAFTNANQIAYEDPYNLIPRYQGSLLEGTRIPIVTCEEAMTAYARINKLPDLATTGYTFERQIAVEHMATTIIIEALEDIALRVATTLQPGAKLRQAIILSDRSALDGAVYSSLRTLNDPEQVDVREVEIATNGWDSYPSAPTRIWPLREWDRGLVGSCCDVVFIPDHSEVPVVDNGFRQTDIQFRQAAAEAMQAYYASVLPDKITILQGDPATRKATVARTLLDLVTLQ